MTTGDSNQAARHYGCTILMLLIATRKRDVNALQPSFQYNHPPRRDAAEFFPGIYNSIIIFYTGAEGVCFEQRPYKITRISTTTHIVLSWYYLIIRNLRRPLSNKTLLFIRYLCRPSSLPGRLTIVISIYILSGISCLIRK